MITSPADLPRRWLAVLLLPLAAACSRPAAKPPAAGRPRPPQQFSAADREKLAAFGESFADAMSRGDDTFVKAAWNANALFDISLAGSGDKAPKDFLQGLRRGFASGIASKQGGPLWAAFQEPCRLLRLHESEGETLLLLRVVSEGGIMYFDLVARINAGGNVEIVDVYIYSSGERMSESLRRLFLPQIANASRTPLAKLLSSPDPLVKHFDKIPPISQAVQAGDYQRAVQLCQALPPEIRDQKSLLIMHVGATQRWMAVDPSPIAEQAYRDCLARFQSRFGNDPAFLVLGIDYYLQLKDFATAHETINKLDEVIGGDPYLDFLRGTTLFEEEKLDDSLKMLRRVIEIEPDIEEPYWALVTVHLDRDDFAAVAQGLDQLVDQFGYEMELDGIPEYDAFRNSAIGKSWLQKHKAQNSFD